jgi:hypothetical protein
MLWGVSFSKLIGDGDRSRLIWTEKRKRGGRDGKRKMGEDCDGKSKR